MQAIGGGGGQNAPTQPIGGGGQPKQNVGNNPPREVDPSGLGIFEDPLPDRTKGLYYRQGWWRRQVGESPRARYIGKLSKDGTTVTRGGISLPFSKIQAAVNDRNGPETLDEWAQWFESHNEQPGRDAWDPQKFLDSLGNSGIINSASDRKYNNPGFEWEKGVAVKDIKSLVSDYENFILSAIFAPIPQFSNTSIEKIIESSRRAASPQKLEGARALDKKLGHALAGKYTSAFSGLKSTQANAEKLIEDILKNPHTTDYLTKYIDVYDKLGRGVRFERDTNRFVGFMEGSLRTPPK